MVEWKKKKKGKTCLWQINLASSRGNLTQYWILSSFYMLYFHTQMKVIVLKFTQLSKKNSAFDILELGQ